MNATDHTLFVVAGLSAFAMGVAIGWWLRTVLPGGVEDMREQRDRARARSRKFRRDNADLADAVLARAEVLADAAGSEKDLAAARPSSYAKPLAHLRLVERDADVVHLGGWTG